MSKLLEQIGFTVKTAKCGEDAIDTMTKSDESTFDVVFMDIFMPGIGGIEATVRIRELTRTWKHTPLVVGCTADTSEKTIMECSESGITRFVHKPVDKKELSDLFHQLRKLQQGRFRGSAIQKYLSY